MNADFDPADMDLPTGQSARAPAANHAANHQNSRSNIILIGASGAGKSSVGRDLARILGFGFIDMDQHISQKSGRTPEEIFAEEGEEHFRDLESAMIGSLSGLRTHVIATGGGAVIREENWQQLTGLGLTVWLNTGADEIARRLLGCPDELRLRPLLADVLSLQDVEVRLKTLTERVSALIGHRMSRYKAADITVSDSFCTTESAARRVREALLSSGLLNFPTDPRPYDRWRILS